MDLFKRARLSPAFTAVPAEPTARDLVGEARIVEMDEQIYRAHKLGRADDRDRLMDLRNAIRPALVAEAPAIPGRTT